MEKERFEEPIRGLTLRQNGRIRSIPQGADNHPVDPPRLPFELFDISAYSTYDELLFLYSKSHNKNIEQGRTLTYFLSRGCPYSCYFCANVKYWNSVAFRSLDYAVSEIAYLKDKYKITHFIMIDPSFTLNHVYTAEFCKKLIEERIDIKFFCSTRVNLVDTSLLELMTRAGLQCIQFGIESGSQKVLNGISKGIRLDEVREKVLTSVDMGLIVKGYFMFGHPNETEADVRMTINFAKDLYDTSCGKFVPVSMFTDIYPGSSLERIARKDGRLDVDFNWFERKIYPQNEKINMGWTLVPIYENEDCKIERILEMAYHNFPELLNLELYKGYDRIYMEKHNVNQF